MGLLRAGKCCTLCRPLDQQKMKLEESKVCDNTSDFSKAEFQHCEHR